MKSESIKKYAIFLGAVALLVIADQWTKQYSEARLATQGLSHIVFDIGSEHDGATVEEYLSDEFRWSSEEEVAEIASHFTTDIDGALLGADTELSEGDSIEVRHREVVIIEDYWDFQYTRNPGAAFGLFADAEESFRKPFFIIVSLLAVVLIIGLLRGVPFRQQLLFWGLTLIAAGALGNFIDRVQFGYVIDFIVWKYTDDYRWPTFNLADTFICVGVAFIAAQMVRETLKERAEAKKGGSDEEPDKVPE